MSLAIKRGVVREKKIECSPKSRALDNWVADEATTCKNQNPCGSWLRTDPALAVAVVGGVNQQTKHLCLSLSFSNSLNKQIF